jgi:hypothetical protein
MNIIEVIRVINRMQTDGVIERYAIGGAVGATFHIEPVSTLDVDIFVSFQKMEGSLLINPQPIFDYLAADGHKLDGEYVVIAGWPVQFLPPTGALVEEALAEAITMPVGEVPARVFTAEHLAAIALQVGRAKDKARLLQFIEAGVLKTERFQGILSRHQLVPAWKEFTRQFPADRP